MERALSVIWGTDVHDDVFQRWTQGFVFSTVEPLALLQYSGGPCAVLAPVQAYLLQKHLYESSLEDEDKIESENWRKCDVSKLLLLRALAYILKQASNDGSCKLTLLCDKTLNRQFTSPIRDAENITIVKNIDARDIDTPVVKDVSRPLTCDSAARNIKGGLKRKHSDELMDFATSSKRETFNEESSTDMSSADILSPMDCDDRVPMEILPEDRMAAFMRRAMDENQRKSRELGGMITLEHLSFALSNIPQTAFEGGGGGGFRGGGEGGRTVTLNALSSALKDVKIPISQSSLNFKLNSSNSSQTSSINSNTVSSNHPLINTTLPIIPSTSLEKRGSKPNIRYSTNLHLNIRIVKCIDEVSTVDCLRQNLDDLEGPFGVLLFLYSVVLTKGVDLILEEREENEEPLIDPLHGHGSQSLVNLLLMGHAVTNVFDLDKDLGGIKLRGVPKQSSVGFLTLLEALRYCQVGTFLKNPVYPIWVVGSETHLTVLFSTESGLMEIEDPETVAKREFNKFDNEGTGLMETNKLAELLNILELETEPDYVQYMASKLDSDNTGVILLNDFLAEFFPFQVNIESPKAFTLYHYNGLQQLSDGGKVVFARGSAVILGEAGGTSSESTLSNCLHTKWPGIVVHWDNQTEPKII